MNNKIKKNGKKSRDYGQSFSRRKEKDNSKSKEDWYGSLKLSAISWLNL